ncbi:UV radiation resistance protein/autophagy-related protein 14 [Tanacetum coccineum]|uniref:UV radiation resistance protein/autophagy-related protein 14 n=1 Tax=Tanacetum coccineum TaxID=301880 RepID=A0ABQ4ZTP3_9ASTR
MTNRKGSSSCGICENSNLASYCTLCVNQRLNLYRTNLTTLKTRRDVLYSKLSHALVAKSKADDQLSWKELQHEKLAALLEKLHFRKEQLWKDKAKVQEMGADLKVRFESLELSMDVLERTRKEQLEKYYPNLICTQSRRHQELYDIQMQKQSIVIKQICKLFPQLKVNIDGDRQDRKGGQYDQICDARLPKGLDPHSVPSDELAASLGYMVQLLNLIVPNVGAPALHKSGFAGSSSIIWQRASYWDERPSSRSNEYPLFIPRQNFCTTEGETSWSDKSSSNFGVTSIKSERKARLDSSSSGSFNYTSASPHSIETHMDLQKGISLLKKSVACVTAYCYNSLGLEVPPEASTFEAFAKLLAMLSSSKEVKRAVSLKMACSRSSKPVQQLNYSTWNVNSAISSSTLLESTHTSASMRGTRDKSLSNSAASYLYAGDTADHGKKETLKDGWDLVEHPTLPPPPSHTEDVEHWTRAMFIDAKDILYHLYMTARGNLQRLMPKEVRIVTIEDPKQLMCGLKDAFTPGDELEGKDPTIIKKMEKMELKGFENWGKMTSRKSSSCGICENSNLASVCTVCVNYSFVCLLSFYVFIGFLSLLWHTITHALAEGLPGSGLPTFGFILGSGRISPLPYPAPAGLNSYGANLNSLKSRRDALYLKLSHVLVAKSKADDQLSWKVLQHEKLAALREKLHFRKEQLSKDKAKVQEMGADLKVRFESLELSMDELERTRKEQLEKYYPNLICTQSLGHQKLYDKQMAITSERLHKQSVVIKQICKLFPQRKVNIDGDRQDGTSGQYDQICNARLPKGLDPHSVPSDELAASLGYMVQLLNLIVHNVGAPALHNSGFAGSSSRIWQRASYWDARPSSRSNEYPLFIPRQNFCTTGSETSWSDKSSSNFGVASMESERKARLDSSSSGSFTYTSASPHSIETHMDLQKGISLLKKSVACVTAYCYNSLCLEVPPEASTFEAFAKLLAMLSSSKEVRTAVSLKMACSRSSKPVQQLNYSVWNVNSAISSSMLLESTHTSASMGGTRDKSLSSSAASYLYAGYTADHGKNETLTDGWDLVEHPTLPPPPSHTEDVEHWTRAMFIDATKRK